MTADAQRACAQQCESSNEPRLPFCLSPVSPQVSFLSLDSILAQILVEQALYLFFAFDDAESAVVLMVGHGGASSVVVPGYLPSLDPVMGIRRWVCDLCNLI